MGTEDRRNSGNRGPVGTEDQENSGVSRKGQGSVANICNNVIGSYSSRCKCLKARASCSGSCTFHSCSNPFEQRQSESANVECGAPRKRRKYDFSKLEKAYLASLPPYERRSATRGSTDEGGVLCRGRSYTTVPCKWEGTEYLLSADPLQSCSIYQLHPRT